MTGLPDELQKAARRRWFHHDILGFCRYYMPHAFTAPMCSVHEQLLTLRGDNVMEVFRGAGKSTCISAVILHALLYEWRRFIIVASWTLEQAQEHVMRARHELENNALLREDWGAIDGIPWRTTHIGTRNRTTLKAVGVRTGVRGLLSKYDRPDMLIVDDVEDDERVQTVEQRNKLYKRLTTSFFNLGAAVSDRDLWVWVIGTPLHRDCVLRRLKEENWPYKRIPATVDGKRDGEPTWPAFDREKIADRIRKVGSKAASQELFLEPLDESEPAFQPEWFRWYDDQEHVSRQWDRYIFVDPAIGLKDGSDSFVATVAASSPLGQQPRIRVLEQIEGQWSVARQVQTIYELAKRHRPVAVGIESNAYQDALRQQVLEYAARTRESIPARAVFSSRTKALRIRDASPVVEFGEVEWQAGNAAHEAMVRHMCEWPSVAHDDIEDSFAGVVQMIRRTGAFMQ